ncbi:MAG: hypothetical protein ACXQTR_05840, partial [Candidatus Methanospirareceae archaeon]
MKAQINSRWMIEKGRWNKKLQAYTDRTKQEFERMLEVEITRNLHGSTILRFIYGPTGHEAYYLYN